MAHETLLSKKLGLRYPLIVAPMAGGPSSPALVTASSEAGALGSIGAAYSTPSAIEDFVNEVRRGTKRPLAVNLFIPAGNPPLAPAQIQSAVAATSAYRKELGLTPPQVQPPFEEDFEAQFEKVLALKPDVLSFVFGKLETAKIRAAKDRGLFLIGTATTLDEAKELEASGIDAITLQGIEGGGHRGLFSATAADPEVTALDLLRQCVGAIKIPLIAAGAIMDATDIKTALSLGAQAVQMGTAFLVCKEAGTSAPYRKALLADVNRRTKTTRVFSGRMARGIENRFMLEMEAKGPSAILPFPAQNKFTRDLRSASAAKGSSDFLSLWAGTGKGPLWEGPCGELIQSLFKE